MVLVLLNIVTLLLLDDHDQQKQQTVICGLAAQHFSMTSIDEINEEVNYRIAPCGGGVKYCSVKGCSYTVSSREYRPCPVSDHSKNTLNVVKDCPVEFVYVWPVDNKDERRWLSGHEKNLTSTNFYSAKWQSISHIIIGEI